MFQWLNKLTRSLENPNVPLNSSAAYDLLAGTSSSSGVHINHRTALGNPAVMRGVRLIADSVAKIPLNIYERGQDDSRDKATKHPAHWLLNRQPNELYTPFVFKQTLMQHALLHGNGYAAIYRDSMGNPVELLILDPESTYPMLEGTNLKYVTNIGNETIKLGAADVLHFRGLCADNGLVGWSIIDVMKDALGLGIALQKYGGTFFKNGAKPSIVITLPPNIRDPEKIERFRNTFGSIHEGLQNSHRPALLMNGSTLETLQASNETGQFLQSREHDLVMVADILGIPSSYLGANTNTSYKSLEADQQNFLSNSLDAWLVMIEEQCEQKLLTETQKITDSHFVEFNRKSLIQIDAQTETTLLVTQLNNGLLSWEEVRKLMNRDTAKNEADGWRRPANIVVEGEEPEQPPAPPVSDPEPTETDEPDEQPPEQPGDTRATLRGLTELTVNRLITRISKAVDSGKTDLAAHRQIMIDSLSPFERCEEITDNLIQVTQDELDHVLPEQRAQVIDNAKHKLMEALWQN